MARWWKETYDPTKHRNEMKGCVDGEYQYNVSVKSPDKLIRYDVVLVEVAGFTFTFLNLRQLEVCLEYFGERIHPSRRACIGAADHWEVQRWYERLPAGLTKEPKRQKVVKALVVALAELRDCDDYTPVPVSKLT